MRGLRAVIRLGLARRPGPSRRQRHRPPPRRGRPRRLGPGACSRPGSPTRRSPRRGGGRYALEAAISGLHTSARTFADTDWPRIVFLYEALERAWPSPSVTVARLAASAHAALAARRVGDLAPIETELEALVLERSGIRQQGRGPHPRRPRVAHGTPGGRRRRATATSRRRSGPSRCAGSARGGPQSADGAQHADGVERDPLTVVGGDVAAPQLRRLDLDGQLRRPRPRRPRDRSAPPGRTARRSPR